MFALILVLILITMTASYCEAQTYDGPAELPKATVASAMADTPAPGAIISVNAGGDLQAALNSAECGDIIQLQAGATFSGPFVVPAKNCNINNWIWISTSSPYSALPPEGTRVTPCYDGIAALEGRPQYACATPTNVMATVEMAVEGDGPFQFAPGANFYRFVGLEITRPAGTPLPARLFEAKKTADHIIVDRSWLHGAPQDETYVGVSLNGMTNAAIVDSYFTDFHCIAITGLCTDAQAISGGVSETQDGPFLIQNNFLEATGEAVMFGGGKANMTPTDITIISNHFWKPWQWMPGSTPFVGGPDGRPFIVKNHLELKNAVRVLIDSNLMDNVWGGFTQNGYGILLTPKNQSRPHRRSVCPKCKVTDVTIRYTYISHAGAGIQMATAISDGKHGAAALAGERFSIHDIVLDDISKSKYNGDGAVLSLSNAWQKNPLNTVTINHITGFPDPTGNMMFIGDVVKTAPMYGLVFTNNLLTTTEHPVWNTGRRVSCAVRDVPLVTMKRCFTSYSFINNGLIGSPSTFSASRWPADNLFPQTVDDVQFTNFNDGDGGNYQLLPSSPYANAGTDGKDLGADIVTINADLANVE